MSRPVRTWEEDREMAALWNLVARLRKRNGDLDGARLAQQSARVYRDRRKSRPA